MNYLLFNSKSAASEGIKEVLKASAKLSEKYGEFALKDLIELNKEAFFSSLNSDDLIVVAGGDGTLNHLINEIGSAPIPEKLFLLPAGTGDDFLNDVKESLNEDGLAPLAPFLKKLPVVETMGLTRRFLNGIGFGIDGECCVKAEEMIKSGAKKINYGSITIKLLFTSYVAPDADVTIDGEKFHFHKIYIAAGMNGRYYGGGMEVAPMQKRGDGSLTFVAIHGAGKLRTFLLFPKLFSGKHIKNKKQAFAKRGKVIEVAFSRPTGLQIDGEIVPNATSYKVYFPEE